jgi:hypothetical protein
MLKEVGVNVISQVGVLDVNPLSGLPTLVQETEVGFTGKLSRGNWI